MPKFQSVPVVDISSLVSAGTHSFDDKQVSVAKEIANACKDVGFFYVINHGIPNELLNQVQIQMNHFFALTSEEKTKISIGLSNCHRGYFGLGEENLETGEEKLEPTYDLKEGFDSGIHVPDPEANPQLAGIPNYGPNQWPSAELLPNFQPTIESYFSQVFELGLTLLRAFAVSLELPLDYFEKYYKGEVPPMPILRLLRYPPQPENAPSGVMGCGPHSDYGFVTILFQDDVGGLEVFSSDGEWVKAPPIPYSLVVNVGDMMARLTNDLFSATVHRVFNYSNRERFSIPFFFDPEFNTKIDCLASCVDENRPKKYPPVVYGEHLIKILNATYTYRKQSD